MNASSSRFYAPAFALLVALILCTNVSRAAGITVDFPGGTVAEFVASIATDEKAHFNLIGDKQELAAILPPINVRNADPVALAMALGQLLHDRGLVVSNMGDHVFALTKIRPRATTIPAAPVPATAASPRFESFQLARYLDDKQTIDEITSAIHTACEFAAPKDLASLQMKFHPGTSLLLVSGSEEALKIATKVIAHLKFTSANSSYSGTTAAEEAARREELRQSTTRRYSTTPPPDDAAATDPQTHSSDLAKAARHAEEVRRIETVAAEVRRRREMRLQSQEAAKAGSPKAAPTADAPTHPESK